MIFLPSVLRQKFFLALLVLVGIALFATLIFVFLSSKRTVSPPESISSPRFEKTVGVQARIPAVILENDWLLYPGAELVEVLSSDGGETATFQTEDSLEQVKEIYEKKLSSSGWKIGSTQEIEGMAHHYSIYSIAKDNMVGGVSLTKRVIYGEAKKSTTPAGEIVKFYTVIVISLNKK